jgi:hypothetical protein
MEQAVRSVWIDPSWLSWEPLSYEAWGGPDPGAATTRPYEAHQHACNRLAREPNEFDRVDAISTLRRIVGRRVNEIKKTYHLRELSTGPKPKGDLELLEYFGIIRPFMLKRLVDIRNIVEHQDSIPPPTEECLMFADLVWYFLRSTDKLVHGFMSSLSFFPTIPGQDIDDTGPLWVRLVFRDAFTEPLEFHAQIDPASLTYEPQANWMRIEATEIIRLEQADPPRMRIWEGNMTATDEQMKHIYDVYFRISHFS